MTNKSYLTKRLSALNVDEDTIDIILFKADLDPEGYPEFVILDNQIYKQFSLILGGTMQNVTEGGYSISWNMEAVKMFYATLCTELGLPNVTLRNAVRDKSNLW